MGDHLTADLVIVINGICLLVVDPITTILIRGTECVNAMNIMMIIIDVLMVLLVDIMMIVNVIITIGRHLEDQLGDQLGVLLHHVVMQEIIIMITIIVLVTMI